MTQNYPILNLPYLYDSQLQVSWLSTKTLSINLGETRDSNNIIDMSLGSSNLENNISPLSIILNGNVRGINGLDVGSLADITCYTVYLIGSSSYNKNIATILSLSSNSYPIMPRGYDSLRAIGYVITDSSANFLQFYQIGTQNERYYEFGTRVQVLFSASISGFHTFSLARGVPPISTSIYIYAEVIVSNVNFNGGLRITGSSPSSLSQLPVQFIPQTSGSNTFATTPFKIMSQVNGGVPQLDWFIGATGGQALSLFVTGFDFSI